MRSIILAAVFGLTVSAAQAETYTTLRSGSGSVTIGPDGYSAITHPMGSGWSTVDNEGNTFITMPSGSGTTTIVTPGYQPQRRR